MSKKWAAIFTCIVAGAFLLVPHGIEIFQYIASLAILIACIRNDKHA